MNQHAELSPSSAHRWIPCPGSVVLSKGRPDVEREEQAEGSVLHLLAAACLGSGIDAANQIGDVLKSGDFEFTIHEEQAEAVQTYVDSVRGYALDAFLAVEQRVPVGHITGEDGAEGTADAIVIVPGELQLHDAKFGRVRVHAENNPQLMLYALGALQTYELAYGPFERVRLVIHQPRLGAVDEWDCSVEALRAFADDVLRAALAADTAKAQAEGDAALEIVHGPFDRAWLHPGETQCHYCPAKAVCPALADKVQELIGADFETIAAHEKLGVFQHNIGVCKKAIPIIRLWCDAVDDEAKRKLEAGEPVDGFKLVYGRQGNRKWGDPAAAEQMLKSFRLTTDQIYTREVISPTKAEELAVAVNAKGEPKKGQEDKPLSRRQWDKLALHITRAPASLSVAPVSDKRPAVEVKQTTAADFDDLTATTEGQS